MDTNRIVFMLGFFAVALCLANADEVVTDKPGAGTDQSQPPLPRAGVAQSVPNFIQNQAGSTVLQNEAGSIYTRPDGRTVLVGANGQTLVTRNDNDDDDDDVDDDGDDAGSYSNVVINSRLGNGVFSSGQGITVVQGNGGSTIQTGGAHVITGGRFHSFNNYKIQDVNGGLQLTVDGKVYDFTAKAADVNTTETVEINGSQATVKYEGGNIVVQLADGTVFAKTEEGLFTGNAETYKNRKQIQQRAWQDAERARQDAANIQAHIEQEMKVLHDRLSQTFGGNFPF